MTLNTGFPETPGGTDYLNRQALNDHSYCCQANPDVCATGEPPLDKKEFCAAFAMQKATKRAENAATFGVPLIFTEFGACYAGMECFNEISSTADACDSVMASWLYWQYKSYGDWTTTGGAAEGMFNEDGTPQALKVKAITRTYMQRYQGTPLTTYFNTKDGGYATTWTMDSSITVPSKFYTNNADWYPNGYKWVTYHPKNGKAIEGTSIWHDPSNHTNQLTFFDERPYNGTDIGLLVTPQLTQTSGTFVSADSQYIMVWEYIDEGFTGVCTVNVEYSDNMLSWVEAYLVNRHNVALNIFGRTFRSNTHAAVCGDLLDAEVKLISKSHSWTTYSETLLSLPLSGANGHTINISIEYNPAK